MLWTRLVLVILSPANVRRALLLPRQLIFWTRLVVILLSLAIVRRAHLVTCLTSPLLCRCGTLFLLPLQLMLSVVQHQIRPTLLLVQSSNQPLPFRLRDHMYVMEDIPAAPD